MFKIKNLIITAIVFFTLISSAFPCDIYFSVINNKKTSYQKGDELVLKVKIHNTHRSCPEDVNKVKFEENGVKILTATRWSETDSGIFERKLKLIVEENKNGKASVKVVRICDKDGGRKTFSINVSK